MFWRSKTLEEIANEDIGVAKPYDELREKPSEAELLHYINYKLGHTNGLLTTIKNLLAYLLIGLAGLAGALWHKGVIW